MHTWVLNDQWDNGGFHKYSESVYGKIFHSQTNKSKLERVHAIGKDKLLLVNITGNHIMETLGKALSNEVYLQLDKAVSKEVNL